jgi:hypothetical protein
MVMVEAQTKLTKTRQLSTLGGLEVLVEHDRIAECDFFGSGQIDV